MTQSVSGTKIDPFLALHLKERIPDEYVRMEASAIYAFEAITEDTIYDPLVNVTLRFEGDLNVIASEYPSLVIRSVIDDLVSAEAPISAIRKLSESKYIIKIESSTPLTLDLDKCVQEVKVDQVRQNLKRVGYDVIVAIIDSGIDYCHEDFRNPDGTTRILYLWDQTSEDILPSPILGEVPQLYDSKQNKYNKLYGREYSQQDIDKALGDSDPFRYVPQKDNNGHGTHVAGIAVGNGRASNGQYMGMAPSADIIFVKFWSKENLGDSNALIHAVQYIFEKADKLEKPVVVNISMGTQLGAHDGTSNFERIVDKLIMYKPGRVVVKSAGNDGNKFTHAAGRVQQDTTTILKFIIDNNDDKDDDLISLWYSMEDAFGISLACPSKEYSPTINLGERPINHQFKNGNIVEIAHQTNPQDQIANSAVIDIKRGSAPVIEPGEWNIRISGNRVVVGDIDAWIDPLASKNSRPKFLDISSYKPNEKSISIPGTSRRIITVGNYNPGLGILDSSSRGPTRDGRVKPEIVCPGTAVTSCASAQVYPNKLYVSDTGTSMSAPCATGIIALMLEKKPSLTSDVIGTIISSSARSEQVMGGVPNSTYGYGILDAMSALSQMKIP